MTPAPKNGHNTCAVKEHCLADRLGVFAAAACAIHCLAAPIILAVLPVVGGIWASPKTHWVFAAISLPTALSLLWRSSSRRSPKVRRTLIGLACTGATLVLVGLAAPGTTWSRAMTFEIPLKSSQAPPAIAASDDHTELRQAWAETHPALDEPAVCQDECCASVTTSREGQRTFALPFASLVTMLGGLLLVTAHAIALRGRHSH